MVISFRNMCWGIVLGLVGLFLGCSPTGHNVSGVHNQQADEGGVGISSESPGVLQNSHFPELSLGGLARKFPPARRISAETLELSGVSFVAESSGSSNYIPLASPDSYAIVPGSESTLAWAQYTFPNLTDDKPVLLEISASQARAGEAGDLLPIQYFVGVANFTGYHWNWWGPFDSSTQVSLNHVSEEHVSELAERFIDESGMLHFIVLASTSSAGEECGVQVDMVTVTTSASYVTNKPHHVSFVDARTGSSLSPSAKQLSALKPEQFVTLGWQHIAPFGAHDFLNAAYEYNISRQAPGAETSSIIGTITAPLISFIDPLDLDAEAEEPVPGTTYEYFISASNSAGSTIPAKVVVTVPILAPEGVDASLDGPDPGRTTVLWQAVNGAFSYEIWRGISPLVGESQLLGSIQSEDLQYFDESSTPGVEYWYFIRSIGQGDGVESNGLEPGALSEYSLGAKGLRKILLSVSGIDPTVSGSGLEEDPYVLESGISYQFTAKDQEGRDLTIVSTWATQPSEAGTFDPVNLGMLGGIQPFPNSFTVEANYSFSSYNWGASVFCTVE